MNKKYPVYLSLLMFLYFGCTGNKVIKDYKKFASIYVDVLIVQEKNKGNFQLIADERNKVFSKYGITEDQFKSTIMYYNQNNIRWGEFFSEVNKRILELKQNLRKKST